MADEQKKIVPINYTNREFNTIRKDLMGVAERLYPGTFQDMSEASFGSLMLDAVAYVGDQLSFYLDYNVNETFLDTSFDYENVLRHGRVMGYKDTGRPSTYGQVAIYIMIPASSTGLGPDTNYIPTMMRGTRFTSTTGLSFVLGENIDFSDPKNPVVVARTSTSTGAPTHYAIKAYGNVVSGIFAQEQVIIGDFERFKRAKLSNSNVSEIISVIDDEGHEYHEVEYLSQDIVYQEMPNTNFKNDNVPAIIKPFMVSRKFVVERDANNTYLQFGSGDSSCKDVIDNPQSVAIDLFGKKYTSNTTFDPTRASKNGNFGISPSNTTLTVVYRATNPSNSNVGVGNLSTIASVDVQFVNQETLIQATINDVMSSVEISNELPITGDSRNLTTSELKLKVYDTFSTQNRAVTQADYENVAYRMPAKFGSVARCSVQRDPDSNKRNLNMYIISEDRYGKLTTTNSTIKNNLKTWINDYRMLNDTIDILDAYIINLGLDFVIKPSTGVDKFSLLKSCVSQLQQHFSTRFYIGEPLYISDIYNSLKSVTGVLDVVKVKVVAKTTSEYSSAEIDINANISQDGDYVICPANAVFEFKYPSVDFKGKVT